MHLVILGKKIMAIMHSNIPRDQFVHQNKAAYKLKFLFPLNSIFTLSDHAASHAFMTIYAHGICLTYFGLLPFIKAK